MATEHPRRSNLTNKAASAQPVPATPRPKRRRWLRWAALLIYTLVLAEMGARGYWLFAYGVPPLAMDEIWSRRFYPELRKSGLLESQVSKNDETFDVLILGGSVISADFGPIDKLLEQEVARQTGRPARVFNCAYAALCSRDSYLKYRWLDEQEFDLVVVYHAINEARLNNCPPTMFKPDYTHSAWYYRIAALDWHPELPYFCLPYTLEHTAASIGDSKALGLFLPKHGPRNSQWTEYGEEVKTAASFRENIEGIVELAAARGADVLLLGYAFHIPENYTLERFKARQLDYGLHAMAIELIGTPRGVEAACTQHNAITRQIAEQYRGQHVFYYDQQQGLPHDGQHFDDVCHLTAYGCARFVENLAPLLAERYGHSAGAIASAEQAEQAASRR